MTNQHGFSSLNNHTSKSHQSLGFFVVIIGLYFAQGLPSGILAKALPPLMRENGISHELIGALKLLALPWFLKFLWAPFIDQTPSRRRMIIGLQALVIPLIAALSFVELNTLLSTLLWPFLLSLLVINTLSATQDIATDGLTASALEDRQLGLANTIQVAAYKLGLILGGSLLLVSIDQIGWQASILLMSILLALSLVPLLMQHQVGAEQASQTSTNNGAESGDATESYTAIFKRFFTQADIKTWLLVLVFCKISDSLGSNMVQPMLVDLGFSKTDIGLIGTTSSVVGLAGAAIGGVLFLRWQSKALLMSVCALQALGIGLFAGLYYQPSLELAYGLSCFEQLVDAISTVVIFAFMMKHCRQGFEGSDYTVQMSIHAIGMGIAALSSGFIVGQFGYPVLYVTAFIAGTLSLGVIAKLKVI